MLDADILVKACRKQAGLSIPDLAEKVGLSECSIKAYEDGRTEPKYCTVLWILQACGFELLLRERGNDE